MKKWNNIYIGLLLFPFCVSCEDILSEKANNEWPEKEIWRIPESAQGVLVRSYVDALQYPDKYDNNFLDAATDNAYTYQTNTSVSKIQSGAISSSSHPLDNWGRCYANLQHINSFLNNGLTDNTIYILNNPEGDALRKKSLKGLAYFLRAWWSFELLRQYGGRTADGSVLGYPIKLHFISEEEAANPVNFYRASYEECAEQIIMDCDSALTYLPNSYDSNDAMPAKVTRYAPLILKSRVLVYAASPAFQPSSIVIINAPGNYSVINEIAYKAKWERAAHFADSIIQDTYATIAYTTLTPDMIADASSSAGNEFRFRIGFNDNQLEGRHYPPYYYGKAQTVPTHNLVNAIPGRDGYPVGHPNSTVSASNPYEGRDKRLDLLAYYHNKRFGKTGSLVDVVAGGKDSPEFHAYGSRTGYYLSKFMSTENGLLNPIQMVNSRHWHAVLRLAEIYHNYAEAANEVWGPEGKGNGYLYTPYALIHKIRSESGGISSTAYMDEIKESKDEFRKLIQNERRLEFAFEDFRYFDMRRWLLPLNEPIKGIVVKRDNAGVLSYEEKVLLIPALDQVKHYYAPIPYEEMIKNKNLVNNIGW